MEQGAPPDPDKLSRDPIRNKTSAVLLFREFVTSAEVIG